MITPAYIRKLAAYNRWQNQNLYGTAGKLSDEHRKQQRGAFFGSIAGTPRPKAAGIPDSPAMVERWEDLERERAAFDEVIVGWAEKLDPQWLESDLTWYSGAAKRDVTKPKALLVAHFFNHQTHHRGQVHCMLTQCGVKPGDTDLSLLV